MKLHHIGIETANIASSRTFYEQIIGFRFDKQFCFQEERLIFLSLNDIKLELIEKPSVELLAAQVHLALQVDCLDSMITLLDDNGYKPVEGPFELMNGWRIVFFLKGLAVNCLNFLKRMTLKNTLYLIRGCSDCRESISKFAATSMGESLPRLKFYNWFET